MLSGAAKTQIEKAAQIQPTVSTLFLPFAKKYVAPIINPSDDTLNSSSSFVVKTCKLK